MKVEKAFEHCESSTWMICLFLPKYLMILTGCIGVAENENGLTRGGNASDMSVLEGAQLRIQHESSEGSPRE